MDAAISPRDISTTVTVRTLPHALTTGVQSAMEFAVPGDVHRTCLANATLCQNREDRFLAMVWDAVAELLRPPSITKEDRQLVYSRHSLSERLLADMCATLSPAGGEERRADSRTV
jgi:hypothetical protein